jgi:FKBP-type peptidyl-prolyl cis-trans isomerase FklB
MDIFAHKLKNMKNKTLIAICFLMGTGLTSCDGQQASTGANTKLANKTDSLSYSLGYAFGSDMSKQLKSLDLNDLNSEILVQALKAAVEKKESVITEQQIQQIISEELQKIQAKKQQDQSKVLNENIEKGKKFLSDNAKNKNVVQLPSGLQYSIIKKGDGPKPKETDIVKTHYHGTLIDGKVFDSSVQRGEPVSFPVNGVIKGWVEALQLMPVGSKWKLFIPYNLAYGEQGSPPSIGPGETLVFEVELISIGE